VVAAIAIEAKASGRAIGMSDRTDEGAIRLSADASEWLEGHANTKTETPEGYLHSTPGEGRVKTMQGARIDKRNSWKRVTSHSADQVGFFSPEPGGASWPLIHAGGSLAGKESWEASSTRSIATGGGCPGSGSSAGAFICAGLVIGDN
jgi:hypothetical protein